jgi:N-acetylglucosamine kinase-like BadF-type ATPase
VAVVCGGGINAVGLAPDGREARFPALGPITGDWGGGADVGVAALGAAQRAADGRGPRTSLERAVPAYFGEATPLDVARAVHQKRLAPESLGELAAVVYEEAHRDAQAAAIVARLGDEVATHAIAALRRLDLTDAGADVVLGGRLLRAGPAQLIERVEQRVHGAAPSAVIVLTADAPIVGATLLGLDALGVDGRSATAARTALAAAAADLDRRTPRIGSREAAGAPSRRPVGSSRG